MEITVTEKHEKHYYPMFGGEPIPMAVAVVKFDVPGDGVTTVTFSQRNDDPEGVWCADSRIGPNGFPVFVHGEGERTCSKQIANPEIVAIIEDFPFMCVE